MRLKTTFGGCLIAATVMAGILPTGVATAAPAQPTRTEAATAVPAQPTRTDTVGQRPRTVTLITGDRLSVATDGSHRFAVLPSPGREPTTFLTRIVKDHLEVVPADAAPLVRSGRPGPPPVRRDGTAVVRIRRHPGRPALIVTSPTGGSALRATAAGAGATVTRDLPAVHGLAVEQSRRHAAEYWKGLTAGPRT